MILKNEKIIFNNLIMEHLQEHELIKIVKKNPEYLRDIKNQTEKICIAAIKQNPNSLKYVKNQNDNIIYKAIEYDALVLKYVKKQTEEICICAVKKNADALQFVKNKTETICIEAIKNNTRMLRIVTQTDNICLAAVEQHAGAFELVIDQCNLLHKCLRINHYVIYYLRDINCNTKTYICIFRYLINGVDENKQKDDFHLILVINKIHTIGYLLKNYYITNSFIWIFIMFLMHSREYSVLRTIRMEQPFYNDIKK